MFTILIFKIAYFLL